MDLLAVLGTTKESGEMMSYEYEIQGNYGYGWDILTTEETLPEAREQLKTYRANERGVLLKIVRVRVA
jgi:hypothetical protein